MKVLESSLAYRSSLYAARWSMAATRCSLVGRFFIALVRVLARVFGDSRVFGNRHEGTRPLERTGHPVSVLIISRPYLWLRGALKRGPVGRAVRSAGPAMAESRFHGWGWLVVAGGGIFALGLGRLALLLARGVTTIDDTGLVASAAGLRLITPILLIVVGVVVASAAPRLGAATRGSVVIRSVWAVGGFRGAARGGMPAAASWRSALVGPLGVGVLLACAAGVMAGLTYGSGPITVAAVAAVVIVLLVLFWRPEAMLLVVAAFPWLDWAARRTLGGLGPAWDDALLILAVVVLLWSVVVVGSWRLWTVPIALPTLLALAAAVGSVVVRDVPGDVAAFALRVLFQPLLFYFLGFLFPKNKRWVKWTVVAFLMVSVALALHGLFQYVTHAPMPARWVDVSETGIGTRAYSVIGNPNGLGAFLLLGALVSLAMALARGLRRAQRVAMAVIFVILAGGVAVTFSRGAWLGLGAGVVALLLMAYRRYIAPLVAVGVVGWFVAPATFTNRLTFAFSPAYITKSMAAGRLYTWKLALGHIAEHPWFGVGLGTFGGTSAITFGYGRLWVDNFYLQLGAEGGLLLLVLFLWILLRAAKGLVRGHGRTHDPYLRALTAGTFGAFIAVAVANATASVWETLVVGVGFWFLTGLATSAALHEEASETVGAEAAPPPVSTPDSGPLPVRSGHPNGNGKGTL